ncbi:MAG: helix-turn-helix transcriptional regulator [Clostridia bacterium]|nr:helix-turn-helix transcriptional regulator [Clostridia bacterium]
MSIGENIARLRKEKGWTQSELGEKIGVSNQAVSKWESGMTMPDITLLPSLADTFGIYIDELFSRDVKAEIHYDHCAEFPWPDDDVIRILQTKGKKILKVQENNSFMEIVFPKNCNETTKQYFKIEVLGNLLCDSSINGDVVCQGKLDCHEINGDVVCHGTLDCHEINGNLRSDGGIYVKVVNGERTSYRVKIANQGQEIPSNVNLNDIREELKKVVPDVGSTSKLLHMIAEDISGNLEMTDENIERWLDAYRDLYKGMKTKK